MHKAIRPISIAGALLLLAACAGSPPSPSSQQAEDAGNRIDLSWLGDFTAPGLRDIVADGLDSNHELRAIAARIDAARARARIAGAERWPDAALQFSAGRNQVRSVSGVSDAVRTGGLFRLETTVSWDLDLWDRLGSGARAAVADAEAVRADYHAARFALAAEITRAWFAVTETAAQVSLSTRMLALFRDNLDAMERRYRSGLNDAFDLRLARENLASAEALHAERLRQHDSAMRIFETLTGRYPDATTVADSGLPLINRPVPAGLPSELLGRRPDLMAAELRLEAAMQRTQAAGRNRLPSLRLTAGGGVSSDELRTLLDWDNLVWSLVAGLTQPLFHGSRLSAERALADADYREEWERYAAVVQSALRDIETALAAEAWYLAQEDSLQRATAESREGAELALSRYRQGLSDILTLLETQRRAFEAESALLRVRRDRLDNRVMMYLALGGNFVAEDVDTPVTGVMQ